MLTWNLTGLLQNQSLETILICIVVCFPRNNIAWIHMCDECKRSNAKRLSQAFVHFVTARASLFTDHKISGSTIPTCAKIEIFQNICAQTVDKSPADSFSSPPNWWSSMHGVRGLVSLLSRFTRKFAISFHAFLCMTFLPSHRTMKIPFRHQVSPWLLFLVFFSVAPAESLDSNILVWLSLLIWHSLWVQPKYTWSRKDVGSPKSTSFMSIFHVGLIFCSLQTVWYRPHTQIKIVLFSVNE